MLVELTRSIYYSVARHVLVFLPPYILNSIPTRSSPALPHECRSIDPHIGDTCP